MFYFGSTIGELLVTSDQDSTTATTIVLNKTEVVLCENIFGVPRCKVRNLVLQLREQGYTNLTIKANKKLWTNFNSNALVATKNVSLNLLSGSGNNSWTIARDGRQFNEDLKDFKHFTNTTYVMLDIRSYVIYPVGKV